MAPSRPDRREFQIDTWGLTSSTTQFGLSSPEQVRSRAISAAMRAPSEPTSGIIAQLVSDGARSERR